MVKPHKNMPTVVVGKRADEKVPCRGAPKKVLEKSVKPLDKTLKVWYNIYTKERVAKVPTEKNFKKIQKRG